MRSESERRESVKHILEVYGKPYNPNDVESCKRLDAMMESYEVFEQMLEDSMPKRTVVEHADLNVV
jgi:hypothetical protein